LGQKTEEVEVLRAAIRIAREKKPLSPRGARENGGFAVSLIARALQVSRSNLMRPAAPQPRPQRQSKDGPAVLDAVKAIVQGRPSYGYPRATALLNRVRRRAGKAAVSHKRIYRLMAANQLLLERHIGKPVRTHQGEVVTLKSDVRWCSDSLELRCWNWEKVHVTFVLDCCDQEVIAFRASHLHPTGETARDLMAEAVERRFRPEARTTPHPVEWLNDNGPIYTGTRRGNSAGASDCWCARRLRTRRRATAWRRLS
jgi:putative transposase